MANSNWVTYYNKLNNSFRKTLVFRIGTGAGFFSEFNNMAFAILYCLKHEIKFVISSRDNNFSVERGWEDYFLPFCEETYMKFHVRYNVRGYDYRKSKIQDLKIFLFKKLTRVDLFTQDIWTEIRNQQSSDIFDIPTLGINGNLVESSEVIIRNIWYYQPAVQIRINAIKSTLDLPTIYYGIHIRSGDKAIEHSLFSPTDYITKLQNLTNCNNVYVATDDYQNIVSLRAAYPDYKFFSICNEHASGHLQSSFDTQNPSEKKAALIDLFAEVDILSNSQCFIGTYSSNIGMYIGMRIGEMKCKCVDFDSWQVW